MDDLVLNLDFLDSFINNLTLDLSFSSGLTRRSAAKLSSNATRGPWGVKTKFIHYFERRRSVTAEFLFENSLLPVIQSCEKSGLLRNEVNIHCESFWIAKIPREIVKVKEKVKFEFLCEEFKNSSSSTTSQVHQFIHPTKKTICIVALTNRLTADYVERLRPEVYWFNNSGDSFEWKKN